MVRRLSAIRAGLLACALTGLAGIGQACAADRINPLAEGSMTQSTITRIDQPAILPLKTGKGDLVQGTITTTGGAVDLDVLDAAGKPVRRLVTQGTGASSFMFMALSGGESLRVSSVTAGMTYAIEITRLLPPEGQVPPEVAYDSPTLTKAVAEARAGKSTEAFWAEIAKAGTPLVEPAGAGMKRVTFLYRGATRNVRILGAPSSDHDFMEHIGGTDIWFKTYLLPDTTRLSYQLSADIPDLPGTARERRVAILATAAADPLNRHRWPEDAPDAYNTSSTITLEAAPQQPYVAPRNVAQGKIETFGIASTKLGNSRTISLYTPDGFDPANPDTVLLFVFDGDAYQTKVPLPVILDTMIADRVIPPVVAVFVPNPDRAARSRELPANPDFAAFMADELLPQVLSRTGLKPDPARTVLAGSSFGGLASVTVALARPDVFGNALSMSGSFWWHPDDAAPEDGEYVAATISKKPAVDVAFFLSAGQFEIKGPGPDASIVESNRHLRDVLVAKGFDVTHREYAAGHDYFAWRGIISDGLIALFGRRDGG